MQASANKLLRVGNPAELNRVQGDSGAFLSKTRIGVESRNKSNLMKSLQNAVSYVQMQEAGIKKLEQTYQRMSQLAMLASDPFLEDSTRAQLNEEFQSLKQDSFSLRSDTFMGNYLYDDMAAKYFPEIDFGKGFTDKTTGDSEVEVGTLTAPPSGWTGTKKYYQLEKEVHFNSGKFVLDVNGGGTGERYILKQGSEVIFDTAGNDVDSGGSKDMQWATEGTAYTYDFDRFEIEFAPGQATKFKFVPLTAGNGTNVAGSDNTVGTTDDPTDTWSSDTRYDNKDSYISQLGIGTSSEGATEESTPWLSGDDRTNHYFSGSLSGGEWKTNPANGLSTKLTLRVEANTIFQINATYTPLDAPTNDKTIEGVNGNDINLESVGIGITLIDSSIDSLDNARAAIGFLDNEIDNLSQQMATIGSNLAELEVASERMRNHVFLSQMGIDRLSDDTLVQESTNYAKEQIRTQASSALVTQAFSISEKVLNFIL